MKFRGLSYLLCVLAIVLPTWAQAPAHESTVDGRWEAKVATQRGEQVTRFEFKNANGEVTGTVTEGAAQPLEIRNGRLDGFKLTFDTMQSPRGNEDPILMSWNGTIVAEAESIRFIRSAANNGESRGSMELLAKRVVP
jgi:hypothetical protein